MSESFVHRSVEGPFRALGVCSDLLCDAATDLAITFKFGRRHRIRILMGVIYRSVKKTSFSTTSANSNFSGMKAAHCELT